MKKTTPTSLDSLREQTEDILKSRLPITGAPLSEAETLKLIHELQVSQIELQLQHEELVKAKELEILHESEERSRNALDHLLEGCQIIGFDWKYIYLNHTAETHNKRPNVDLIGNRYMDIWPGIEETEVFQIIKQTLELRVSDHFENEFVFPDGSHGWFDLSIQPVPEGAFILSIDITERKRAEKDLRTSEEKYRLIADNSEAWIYWVAPDGHLHYVSPACERITGYSPEEFADRPELNQEIVFDADKEKFNQHHQHSKLDNISHELDYRIVTKSGEIRWVSHSCSPIFNEEGKYLGRRGTNRNITERKLQEEQLYESEFRFSKLYENGPFGMVMANKEFRFKKANPAFCEIIGYDEAELQQFTFKDVTHPDDLAKDMVNVRKLMNQEIPVYKAEKRYIRKDGQVIWGSLTVTANYDSEGQFLYNLGIIEDISQRKQAEEDLKKSKQLLSETESMGKVGGWEFNIDTLEQTWTDEVYRIHEVDLDFKQDVDKGINFYTPESRPIIEKAVQRVLEFGEPFDLELEIITAKGNLRKVHSVGKADLENHRVYGFFQDITERKRVEEEIQKLNERISTATRASQVGIWDWDVKNNVLVWDDQMYALYGLKNDEFTGAFEAWVNGLHPDDKEFCLNETQLALFGKKEYDTEFRVIWPDGTIRIEKARGEVFRNELGEPIRMIGINYDITEQKKIDQKIREKDQEFRKLSANVPDLLFQFTRKPDGSYCVPIASEGIRNIFGCAPEDVIDDFAPIGRVIYPEDAERVIRDIEYSAAHLTYFTCEFRVQIPGREIQWIYSKSTPERLPDGSITWYGFNTDITQKKLAEEALKISEEQYRNIFESAVIGIYRTTPDGKIIMANSTLIKLLGFESFEEMAHRNLEKEGFESENERNKFRESIEKAGHVIGLESVWKTKDGQSVIVNENAKAFYDSNGRVIYYEGTIEDITERKNAEKALRTNEALLKEMGRIAKVGGWEFDIRTGNASWTEEVARIHDLDPEIPPSIESGINYYTKSSRPIIEKAVQNVIEFSIPYDLELEIISAKGTHKWIRTIGHPVVENGKVIQVHGSFQDITERKLAEEALRESEEKFRKLLESIPLPVTYVNSRGDILFRNDRFLQVLGYSHKEVPTVDAWWGKAYQDENYRNHVIQQWGSAVEEANITNTDIEPIEYRITCKDGFERTMIVSGIIIEDNLLITFIDITDRKKAEEEVRRLNETLEQRVEERTTQLQEANKELEAFSYSVSHDLRAPLRHINGFVDLLTENYTGLLPEKGQHYLEIIANSSRHMGTLIDDLLQFSRTGRQEMQEINLNMNVVLQDVLNSLELDIKKRKIEWNIAVLPNIKGDQSLLRMAWFNLLSNAVKFTKAKDPAQIQIGFIDDEKEYTFFVRDNGAGFDMRFAHKLFGVFQRLHTTKEFEGTGIGLANVRRIILKHGGRTWAESKLNEGATFYFTLPKLKY